MLQLFFSWSNFFKKLVVSLVLMASIFGILSLQYVKARAEENSNVKFFRDYNVKVGKADSNIKVVYFFDFQCPGCRGNDPVLTEVREKYKDRIEFVYRNYPLSIHPFAKLAAQGGQAAAQQGIDKYFQYKNEVFAIQSEISSDNIEKAAIKAGVDIKKWRKDIATEEIKQQVEQDLSDAQNIELPKLEDRDSQKITGIPATLIIKNGKIADSFGYLPVDQFRQKLDNQLLNVDISASEEKQSFCPQNKKLYTNSKYPDFKACYDESWEVTENQDVKRGQIGVTRSFYFSKNDTKLTFENLIGGQFGGMGPSICYKKDDIKFLSNGLMRRKDNYEVSEGFYKRSDIGWENAVKKWEDITKEPYIRDKTNNLPFRLGFEEKLILEIGKIREVCDVFAEYRAVSVIANLGWDKGTWFASTESNSSLINEADKIVENTCFNQETCDKLKQKMISEETFTNKESLNGFLINSTLRKYILCQFAGDKLNQGKFSGQVIPANQRILPPVFQKQEFELDCSNIKNELLSYRSSGGQIVYSLDSNGFVKIFFNDKIEDRTVTININIRLNFITSSKYKEYAEEMKNILEQNNIKIDLEVVDDDTILKTINEKKYHLILLPTQIETLDQLQKYYGVNSLNVSNITKNNRVKADEFEANLKSGDLAKLGNFFKDEEVSLNLYNLDNNKKGDSSTDNGNNQNQGQFIELEFNRHCDGRTNLNKSSIPVPELTEINQDLRDQWKYNIKGNSIIKKGTKIKAKIWYDKCNLFAWKTGTEYKEFIIEEGFDKVIWNAYKDTIQGKTEDIEKNIEVESNSKFNFDIIKRGGIDVWPDGKKVWETDQIYTKLEIYGDFEVDLPDIGKTKFDYGKGANESGASNMVKLSNPVIAGETGTIEEPFETRGGNPDGLLITAEVENRRDIRKAKFSLSDEDKSKNPDWKNKDKLPKDAKIWIISHGWNDYDNPKFREIAETIKKDYPKDIVLTLNWSEASTNGQTPGSPAPDPKGVCRASTWIKSTAEQAYNKLNQIWGINRGDGKKIRVVGHSLGSIISTEISQQFAETKYDNSTSGADLLIALDPPSEISCRNEAKSNPILGISVIENSIDGKYKISPKEKRKDFASNARFTRSFVGRNSFAGNQNFAKTADDSFWMDFSKDRNGIKTDEGAEHVWVVQTYRKIMKDTKIKNTFYDEDALYKEESRYVLDLSDINVHTSWERKFGNHRGSIEINEPGKVDRLVIKVKNKEDYLYP